MPKMQINRCPTCAAAVRPGSDWCTLCYADLRVSEPVVAAPPPPAASHLAAAPPPPPAPAALPVALAPHMPVAPPTAGVVANQDLAHAYEELLAFSAATAPAPAPQPAPPTQTAPTPVVPTQAAPTPVGSVVAPPAIAEQAARDATAAAQAAGLEPGPAPGWPCTRCHEINNFDAAACTACSSPFGAGLAGRRPTYDKKQIWLWAICGALILVMLVGLLSFLATDLQPGSGSGDRSVDAPVLPAE